VRILNRELKTCSNGTVVRACKLILPAHIPVFCNVKIHTKYYFHWRSLLTKPSAITTNVPAMLALGDITQIDMIPQGDQGK
jgi:hypothetical protein